MWQWTGWGPKLTLNAPASRQPFLTTSIAISFNIAFSCPELRVTLDSPPITWTYPWHRTYHTALKWFTILFLLLHYELFKPRNYVHYCDLLNNVASKRERGREGPSKADGTHWMSQTSSLTVTFCSMLISGRKKEEQVLYIYEVGILIFNSPNILHLYILSFPLKGQ